MDNETAMVWFCLKHHTVEDERRPLPRVRTGSVPSHPEAASRALETVQRRNEEWDAKD